MSKTLKSAIRWTAVALTAGFIFFMSSRDATQLGSGFFSQVDAILATGLEALFGPHGDMVSPLCHFSEYLLLSALTGNALRGSGANLSWALAGAVLFASLFGITDEIHQLFVPGRMCDPLDWITDTLGAATGALLLGAAWKTRNKDGGCTG